MSPRQDPPGEASEGSMARDIVAAAVVTALCHVAPL
jgi:hypothetical protein